MIFYQLLLAHLIADFPLQFNEIFKLKVKSKWGVLLHCAIVGVVAGLFLFPYVNYILMWLAIITLIGSHFITDYTRVVVAKKNNVDNLWMFLLDQFLHIVVVWLISLSMTSIPSPSFVIPESIQDVLNNKVILLTVSGFITAGYFGAIVIHYLKKMFDKNYTNQALSTKRYGIIERFLVMTLIIMPGLYFLFIPTVIITRISISKIKEKEYDLLDSIASIAITVILGLILKIAFWM